MKFEQTATLIGVVGKKGSGKLDNGNDWSTDRVELHCLAAFPDADQMAHGQTAMVYNVEDYAANYDRAKSLIDQRVTLQMEMVPAKKLGQPPRMVCIGFYGELPKVSSKNSSQQSV